MGTKARDFIDVYLIQKNAKTLADDIIHQIIEKTKFMLTYERYRENLIQKTDTMPTFKLGEEEHLILKPLGDDFKQFTKDFNKTLVRILTQTTKK